MSIAGQYLDKQPAYFSTVRWDIINLLEDVEFTKVFEIGCGSGETLREIMKLHKCSWVGGLELLKSELDKIGGDIDFSYSGKIEEFDWGKLPTNIDLILALDVIEHTLDPWSVLQNSYSCLSSGGKFIVSVPNIANLAIIKQLVWHGDFWYTDSGILDRTHTKFWTEKSLVRDLKLVGFEVDTVVLKKIHRRFSKSWFLSILLPERFLATQIIVTCSKR